MASARDHIGSVGTLVAITLFAASLHYSSRGLLGPFLWLLPRKPYGPFVSLWREPSTSGHGLPGTREVLADLLRNGWELAAQVSAYKRGACVTNQYGRQAHLDNFTADSMAIAFSTGKVVGALVILMLVDRGRLNYSDQVTRYWPKFPRKECTVQQLLGHDCGFAYLDHPIPRAALEDAELLARLFEAQHARHPPAGRAYHAVTWGFVVDLLVRRVDERGRNIGQFLSEEIAVPLGISHEVFVGLPPEEEHRVEPLRSASCCSTTSTWYIFYRFTLPTKCKAWWTSISTWWHPAAARVARGEATAEALSNATTGRSQTSFSRAFFAVEGTQGARALSAYNEPFLHRAIMPGSNIIATAHGLATIGAVLAESGTLWQGIGDRRVRLFRPRTLRTALQPGPAAAAPDAVLGINTSWTVGGFYRYGKAHRLGCTGDACGDGWYGWPGSGGSLLLFSRQIRASYAYVTVGLAADYADSKIRWAKMLSALHFSSSTPSTSRRPRCDDRRMKMGTALSDAHAGRPNPKVRCVHKSH